MKNQSLGKYQGSGAILFMTSSVGTMNRSAPVAPDMSIQQVTLRAVMGYGLNGQSASHDVLSSVASQTPSRLHTAELQSAGQFWPFSMLCVLCCPPLSQRPLPQTEH